MYMQKRLRLISLSILTLILNKSNTEEKLDSGKEKAALWHIWMERNSSMVYTQQETIKYVFTAEIPKENNTGRNHASTIQQRGFLSMLVHLRHAGLIFHLYEIRGSLKLEDAAQI